MATSSTPAPLAGKSAMPSPNGFPGKTALAIGTAVAVLAGAHLYKDRTRGIAPGIFAETARLRLPHPPTPVDTRGMPYNGVQQTPAQAVVKDGKPAEQPISPFLTDDSHALDPFFASLFNLEQHRQPEVVTILHYGDSPTTADLITGDARALLQARFGDAGHGFNLVAKPWAWYGHRDVDITDKGWNSAPRASTGVGKYRQSVYGLGGATITGSTGAHTTFRLKGAPQTGVDLQYLASPGGGTFTVSAGDTQLVSIDTHAETATPANSDLVLPPDTKQVSLDVAAGTVTMFGADFHRGGTGVLYQSMGLNGATTTVLSRTFEPAAWAIEMRHAKPSLIIINYGTNESEFGGLVQTLDKELRTAIDRTRTAAPGVPILIMSPMDRGERSGNAIGTMAAIPQIVAIQQQVAADTGCAFFNTYAAMGGSGTFAQWYAAKPRLVTADLIHPTPQGAAVVAKIFVDNLGRGYDRWKHASPASH